MTSIEKIRLAVVASLLTAFAGPPFASAESTALCKVDEAPCALANRVSHVHEATPSGNKARLLTPAEVNHVYHIHEVTPSGAKARLLTSFGTVECNALFLGDAPSNVNSPLVVGGHFTYTSCALGASSCTATEEKGPSEILVLKESHEAAEVTGEGLVHLVCGSSLDCSYNGTGLVGTGKGPLLSTQANGDVTTTGKTVTKEAGGFLCPKTSKLDITATPLEATYITGGGEGFTELCKEDPGIGSQEACPFVEGVTVECDALFLGDAEATLGNPLVVKGKFSYSNCNHECVVTEENGPSEIKTLKEGHETTKVTGEGLMHIVCSGYIDCSYNGVGLVGTGKGPLLSTQANGEVTTNEAMTNKETGSVLCPKTSKLDITTTPLSATYISS